MVVSTTVPGAGASVAVDDLDVEVVALSVVSWEIDLAHN
jgi:hypothetical protein